MAILSLPSGSSTFVAPCHGALFARLLVIKGILRLSASYGQPLDDITLAFAGPGQPELIRLDPERAYLLEAITDAEFDLQYLHDSGSATELTAAWLLSFNLILHYPAAYQRVNRLLCLFAEKFGSKSQKGFFIPFALSHARLAELTGCRRSTVTRQLVNLRELGLLRTSAGNNSMELTITDSLLG